jgi:hypothetical protein
VTDRGLNDMRCFRGGFTLGVHKISFLEFSPSNARLDLETILESIKDQKAQKRLQRRVQKAEASDVLVERRRRRQLAPAGIL